MPETSLQMLEIARNQSAGLVASIQRNVELSLQTQKQISDAEVGLRFQGLQFAENARMNDARIIQMNNQNELNAKEFELKAELAPLQLETQKLQLETQRQIALNTKQKTDMDFMSTITAPWDRSVASRFAANQDPSYMQSYLDMKSKWMSRVASGEKFNGDAYQSGIDQLNAQYKDSKPPQDGAWSPEISNLLGLADRETQEQYNLRNPEVMASKNMVIGSFLETKDPSKFWQDYGRLFKGEEDTVAKMDIARTAFQSNENAMESLIEQMNRIGPAMSLTDDPEVASQAKKEYSFLYNQYTDLQKRNQNIKMSFATGNVSMFDKPQAPPAAAPIADVNTLPTTNTVPTAGVLGGGESSVFKTRLEKVTSLFTTPEAKKANPANPLENTEIKDVNVSWFENNLEGEMDSTTKKRIKNEILEGIEATGSRSMYNEDKIKSLFSTIEKQTAIPISPYLAKQLFSNLSQPERAKIIGIDMDRGLFGNLDTAMSGDSYNEKATYMLSFGPRDSNTKGSQAGLLDASSFSSFDSMQKIINSGETKQAREQIRKELFSALTTAAFSSAVSGR